jgi:hypothetical protein
VDSTRKTLKYLAFFVALSPVTTFAEMLEKYPSHGFLSGDIDHDYIEFQCLLRRDSKLACSFDQISISHKDTSLQEHQDEALSEFRQKIAPKDCPSALTGSADFAKRLSTLPIGEQHDLLKTREAFTKACKNPIDENILEFIGSLKSLEQTTCKLSFNHFEQVFDQTLNGSWTAVTQPGGPCGSMFIATFEPLSGILWKYKSRHINTIKYPKTDNLLLDICNSSDERERERV